MKHKTNVDYLIKGSDDWVREGHETYMLAKDDYLNIMKIRKETVMQEARDKRNQNNVQEKELLREEKLAQKSLNDMGGEVPIKSLQRSIRTGWALFGVCVLLWGINFGFVLWSLEPFGWGSKAYLFAVGATITFGILCERIFSDLKRLLPERYYVVTRLYLLVGGAVASLLMGLYLTDIRADISSVALISEQATEVAGEQYEQTVSDFYTGSSYKLLIGLILFTISIETVAGILLHLGVDKIRTNTPIYDAIIRIKKIRNDLNVIAVENKRLEGAHEVFENQFLHGVALAEAELKDNEENGEEYQAKRLIWRLVIFIIVLIVIFIAVTARADTSVIAIDLSQSSDHTDYVGTSEFEKNKKAVGDFISRIDAGLKLYVIGITEDSLGKPYYILTARTTDDPGYFKEKIRRDKRKILHNWQNIEGNLKPSAHSTDIFGAIYLAETILKINPSGVKELIIFSDMRNTEGINLSSLKDIETQVAELSHKRMRIPDLNGVKVSIYGVHNKGNSDEYRNKLMGFWRDFITKANAELVVYTSMREVMEAAGTLTMSNQ